MSQHAQMFIAGFLGVIIHVLVKIGSINKKLNTTDYKTVFKQYWTTDWVWVLLAIAGVFTAVFISNEWLDIKETDKTPANIAEMLQFKFSQFIKTAFVLIGFCIDSIVATYLSGTEQRLIKNAQANGVAMDEIIKVVPDKPVVK